MSSYIGLECGGGIQTKAETTVYILSLYIYTQYFVVIHIHKISLII